ncbi:hypothetical protein [Paenibacillus sp. B-A-8]|uniref:hypothetical protein n=1 Tax=Paenibacillus sp. B-A-8 TaxID=3400419 RepID=UPI003B02C7B5
MNKFNPPKLVGNFASIVSDEADLELVAKVSCYLYKPGAYTPMFILPRAEYAYKENFSLEDDSFFSDVVVGNASRTILNCIAHINCKLVLLIGLNEVQKSFLNIEQYYKVNFIEINTISELEDKLKFLGRLFDGNFYCKKNDIAKALCHSLQYNKLLVVSETAQPVTSLIDNGGDGIVVLESKNDISELITVIYASSIKADLKFVRSYHHSEIMELKNKLYKWKREFSYGSYIFFNNTISDSLTDVDFTMYQYATFFTDGIPYGVIYNSTVPCSHVLQTVSVDIFLFNNILYEQSNLHMGSALIFSPQPEDLGEQTAVEVEKVNNSLAKVNFSNKNLLKKKATVKALDNFVGHYPYDILHICSHGGRIDGYYVVQKFLDRNGREHTVEYDEIAGFSPDGKEFVNVTRKIIYRFLDDLVWRSKELEEQNYPDYVYKDLLKSITDDKINVQRTKVDYPIEGSCHVQCYDDIHQGQFSSLASHGSPFIFNNSCTSWEEFALHLLNSGCRAYIGTLWNISNEVAVTSSEIFYNTVFKSSILDAFQIMISSIDNDNYKEIYIFCGLHFSTIKKSSNNSLYNLREKLLISINRWIRYSVQTKSFEYRKSALSVIKFLNKELVPFYSNDRVIEALIGSACFIHDFEKQLEDESINTGEQT